MLHQRFRKDFFGELKYDQKCRFANHIEKDLHLRAFLSMFFVVTYTDPGTNNPIKAQCFNKKTHINSIPMTKTSLIKQDLKQKMAHGLRLNIPRATVETYLTTMILNSLSLFPNYVFSPKRLTLLSSKTP